jgi:hypothetical protein
MGGCVWRRDAEGAKELLYKSIELSPKRGHAKYVLLGHLDCGTSAIASFEKALEILELEVRARALPLPPQRARSPGSEKCGKARRRETKRDRLRIRATQFRFVARSRSHATALKGEPLPKGATAFQLTH